MKAQLIILFLSVSALLYSQDVDDLDQKFKDYNTEETKEYNWLQKHFMVDVKYNILGEIFSPEPKTIRVVDKTFSDYDTIEFQDRNLLINLIGIGLEPRVSLYENDKFTLGIKSSIHFNLSLYTNFDSNYKNMGTFHLNTSGMVYFAKGLSSTFSNTEESGFSISGGVMYLKAPLLGGGSAFLDLSDDRELLPESEEFLIDSFLIPAIQFDYYILKQDFKVRNFSIALSHFNSNTYFRFNYGITL